VFSFSLEGELRREEVCADAIGQPGKVVMMMHCHGHRGNQFWQHFRVNNVNCGLIFSHCFSIIAV
jgi:hypothetical protein